MISLSMLSRKLYLRLKRIAEADFQQFFKNTEDTLLMFDDQDYERHEERKLGLPFDFFLNTENGEERLKKAAYPSTSIYSQLICIAQLLSQPRATRVSIDKSKSMVSKFIFRWL